MQPKPAILISACLLGENVKYDGGNNILERSHIATLRTHAELVPVCPEVLGGLPVPRTPAESVGEKVVDKKGNDVTAAFEHGAQAALSEGLARYAVAAILKEGSPSCGVHVINDGTFSKIRIPGSGATTRLLEKNGIKTFNENEIQECLEYINTN